RAQQITHDLVLVAGHETAGGELAEPVRFMVAAQIALAPEPLLAVDDFLAEFQRIEFVERADDQLVGVERRVLGHGLSSHRTERPAYVDGKSECVAGGSQFFVNRLVPSVWAPPRGPSRNPRRGPLGQPHQRGRIGAMLRITTVNVNGIRAALRKGMGEWMQSAGSQIITLQEVRAANDIVFDVLDGSGYHVQSADAEAKGRAGVAILSRTEPVATRTGIGDDYFDTAGRWIESDFRLDDGSLLTVVSAY